MYRTILTVGQQPLVDDLLNTNRNTMLALGYVMGAAWGLQTTAASGFAITAGPAGGQVTVGVGSIMVPGEVDPVNGYGVLGTDTRAVVKNYLMDAPAVMTLSGNGPFYIYATPVEQDDQLASVPIFTSATTSATYQSLAKRRSSLVSLGLGLSIPAGTVPLWQINSGGASAITPAMVVPAPGSVFFPTIPQLAQGRMLSREVLSAQAAAYAYQPSSPFVRTVVVHGCATGGAGGNSPATGSQQGAAAGGASSGAWGSFSFDVAAIAGAAIAVPVGPLGADTQNNGLAGSPLTIIAANGATLLNLPGGIGGGAGHADVSSIGPGAGATSDPIICAGNSLFQSIGEGGQAGISLGATTNYYGFGGAGGSTPFGGGGAPAAGQTSGNAGGYGGGGGGGCAGLNSSARSGGKGGDAHLIVEEWS